jgi:hypothetical protein
VKKTIIVAVAALALSCARAPDTNPLRDAVANYSHAMLTGDENAAYHMLSNRCRERLGRKDIGGVARVLSSRFKDERPLVTAIVPEPNTDDRHFLVNYDFPEQPEINQVGESWSYEDGEWRNDEC